MSQDKRIIQLENGEAEEGDRVFLLDEMDDYPEGTIFLDREDGDGVWTFYPDEGEPIGWPQKGDLMKEVALLFSPTDALEAVEEEERNWIMGDDNEIGIALQKFSDQIKSNINQKRKGHE